ncbi:immunity 22 family protein [Paenibacillus hodogayensis]|uniref:Immunity 22 family protein n=1 Tax=Paenibacillus hodogayensis TaxID=279208 RepID=A0ABV5VPQ1_9BACL
MKHIVMIWGANISSSEELEAFVESVYDDDGDALPSAFLASIGRSWIDGDFLELHVVGNEEERIAFIEYLRLEYSPHEPFVEQLPAALDETVQAYNAVILLYGNDSPYGAVNEEMFQWAEEGFPAASSVVLLASVQYESR